MNGARLAEAQRHAPAKQRRFLFWMTVLGWHDKLHRHAPLLWTQVVNDLLLDRMLAATEVEVGSLRRLLNALKSRAMKPVRLNLEDLASPTVTVSLNDRFMQKAIVSHKAGRVVELMVDGKVVTRLHTDGRLEQL